MTTPTHGPFRALTDIVLASASPRRRELLANAGVAFAIVPAEADEPRPKPDETPADYAERMARLKALDTARRCPGKVVIGSDTVVALGREIMGKPVDDEDALRMLQRLSGRTHQVITGVSVVFDDGKTETFHAATDVTMRTSGETELRAYVATGEPADKAGAYAIQGIGTFLVREISGSYSNVVGLPLTRVLEVLVSWGVVVPREG